jgi:hypothetical protein
MPGGSRVARSNSGLDKKRKKERKNNNIQIGAYDRVSSGWHPCTHDGFVHLEVYLEHGNTTYISCLYWHPNF